MASSAPRAVRALCPWKRKRLAKRLGSDAGNSDPKKLQGKNYRQPDGLPVSLPISRPLSLRRRLAVNRRLLLRRTGRSLLAEEHAFVHGYEERILGESLRGSLKVDGSPFFGQQFGGKRRRHRQLHIRLIRVDVIQAGSQRQLGRGRTDHFCAAQLHRFSLDGVENRVSIFLLAHGKN